MAERKWRPTASTKLGRDGNKVVVSTEASGFGTRRLAHYSDSHTNVHTLRDRARYRRNGNGFLASAEVAVGTLLLVDGLQDVAMIRHDWVQGGEGVGKILGAGVLYWEAARNSVRGLIHHQRAQEIKRKTGTLKPASSDTNSH